MTSPRSRHHRQDGRAPTFADGFGDDGRDITEVLEQYRGAVYDGDTYKWGGASDVGLPDGGAYPHGHFTGVGDQTAWHPAPGAEERRGIAPTPPEWLRAQRPAPDMFPALQPPYPPYPDPPPAAPVGYEVTGRETGQGWPHLFELRCDYPAALAATPIPCDSAHRDAAALSFRDLRRSAQAAGWHMDRLEQWACPRCCQASTEYRGLYPFTVYDMLAAEAYVVGDLRGENRERARAELAIRERTLDHYAASHEHGRHARAARQHAKAAS